MRDWCEKENPDCKYFDRGVGCFSDGHHIFGRARARAVGQIAFDFAMLPENVEQLCRAEHDELHATTEYPPFPDLEIMKLAIEESKNGRLF